MTNIGTQTNHPGFCYRHSGVHIASDFEIPEWMGFAAIADGQRADIQVKLGTAELGPIPRDAHGVFADGSLTFDEPDAGRWSIQNGKRIVVQPLNMSRIAVARLYTLGSAWGTLGYQRGWAMLHGSAVQIGGRTALFAGSAKMGKSTLAAALVQAGARLLSDDLSRVEPPNGEEPAKLWPSGARLKLWDETILHFGWQDRNMEQDHYRDRKFHLPMDAGPTPADPEAISAAFLLEWGNEIAIERLRGAAAVRALAAGTMYRKEYLELMGKLGEQIVHCARIASQVPVYRLVRPKKFVHLDEVCENVARSLARHEA